MSQQRRKPSTSAKKHFLWYLTVVLSTALHLFAVVQSIYTVNLTTVLRYFALHFFMLLSACQREILYFLLHYMYLQINQN